MSDRIVLNAAYRNNILAIRHAQRTVDDVTFRLASGLKVNSALDDPQNFFAARALNNRSSDFSRLLDGIGSSVRTIETGLTGVKSLERLLRLGESVAQQSLDTLTAQTLTAAATQPLNTQILAASPVGYWPLGETSGASAINQGSIGGAANAAYVNGPILGAGALYDGGGTSVDFNGVNQSASIPNHPQLNTSNHALRSVELVFNADTTAGRQVLYEEGGTTNAFSIYVFNGNLYVNGRDGGAWGPVNISMPIVSGETYHVGFTFDFPAGVFRGYVNGVEIGNASVNAIFPSHSGNIGIGAMNNGTWFHDGAQAGNNFYFNGRISDVAVYNSVLTPQQFADHAASVTGIVAGSDTNVEFDNVLSQINQLVRDTHYRGVQLLFNDDLTSYFNEDRSHRLVTKGVDFTASGLGVRRTGFNDANGIRDILASIRGALSQVREYGRTLSSDINILSVREAFTRSTINTLSAGALDLTRADENEEGARLLAAQTRLELATTSLALANVLNASVLDLFA